MTNIFHRMPRHVYPTAVRGDGAYIIDASGKRYLDASGGAAVSCLGHSNRKVIEAIKAQLDELPFAHTSFFTTSAAEELAALIAERAPPGLDHVYFLSGGSEAVEAALKMARQYFVEKGEPERCRFIARNQSYHGNTIGALSVGGNPGRRALFEPILIDVEHVSPCFAYRNAQPGETEDEYGRRLAEELESTIRRLGPETVIAFVAETVSGATLGAVPPVTGYFKRIREVCDRYGILLILDEVMCGMGRTGTLFACEQDGVIPDIVTIAKGLGAGYQPIGATVASSKIFEMIVGKSGFFHHGHTYVAHATACAAALAVQKVIIEENLLDQVQERGRKLYGRLREAFGQHQHVGDIRGRGLFWGVELVEDRDNKASFDPSHKLHSLIKLNAMDAGLMCYPSGGTIDGVRGDHVLLAPPYIINDSGVDEIVDKLSFAIQRSIDQIRSRPAAALS
ncbi:aspartate aminotransferase family protein [Methylocapsa sp. S129]|uniref:aspartate aminotransferase family protein n=1 Tax=Methylocapsa sp. S129 TaxID=1641869 RepID=UPI00131CE12B|nr:aspartate aminotransferase family protein [Methylocapsa sp. S129]